MKQYDIIVVGSGAAGVFLSYELTRCSNRASVLMIDKGDRLENRSCPIKSGITETCIKCNPCHIMNGYGGRGPFPTESTTSPPLSVVICRVCGHGQGYGTDGVCGQRPLPDGRVGISCTHCQQRPQDRGAAEQPIAGRQGAPPWHRPEHQDPERMYDYAKDRIEIEFRPPWIPWSGQRPVLWCARQGQEIPKDLVLATGRSGLSDLRRLPEDGHFHAEQPVTRPSGGTPAVILHITDEVYESKIVYKTDKYNDKVRTSCMNPMGKSYRKTPTASLLSTGTATQTKRFARRTPILRCWCPTTLPSLSATAMSTANPSPGCPTCWAAACCSRSSATWSKAAAPTSIAWPNALPVRH